MAQLFIEGRDWNRTIKSKFEEIEIKRRHKDIGMRGNRNRKKTLASYEEIEIKRRHR